MAKTFDKHGSAVDLVADPHDEPVKFVNEVISTGHLNGNINVEFSALRFSATQDLKEVVENRIVAARLRMDLHCANQLYTALGSFLAQLTKPADTKDN